MPKQLERVSLHFHSLPEDKQQELLYMLPETRAENGQIDFERLKLVLGYTVDVGKEPPA